MSELTVKFNGIDLSKFLRVVDIDRSDQNEIVLTVKMRTSDSRSMQKAKRELRQLLMTRAYQELIFSDEPELFYYAKVVKPFDESNKIAWFQDVEITFHTLDGYAYSTSYEYIPDDKITTSNKIITIDFDNQGSVDALPIIELTNTSENGFVGVVALNCNLEIGDVEESDTATKQMPEMMCNFQPWKAQEMLTTGVQKVGVANDNSQSNTGTLGVIKKTDGTTDVDWLYLTSPGTASGYILNGQSLTFTAKADASGQIGSLFESIYWRQVFHTTALPQQGAIKVMVSDENGRFLYGCETLKRSNSNITEFNGMIANPSNPNGYDMVRRTTFQANHILSENPFMNANGNMVMHRNDDVITFYERGNSTHQSDYLKGKKSHKVHIWMLTYAGKQSIGKMFLSNFCWQKHNVQNTINVPNRYAKYSNIVINNEMGKVTVDGIGEPTVLGSEYIKLPVGKSQMKMHFSSFIASLPNVKVKYRKRFR